MLAAGAITSLQFHDRLMQQLAQVLNILGGRAADRVPAMLPAATAGGSVELF